MSHDRPHVIWHVTCHMTGDMSDDMQHLEEISAEWTCWVVACVEPSIETLCVKSLATRATLFAWQLIWRAVKHGVADVTLVDTFKVFVHVALPQLQPVNQRPILHMIPVTAIVNCASPLVYYMINSNNTYHHHHYDSSSANRTRYWQQTSVCVHSSRYLIYDTHWGICFCSPCNNVCKFVKFVARNISGKW